LLIATLGAFAAADAPKDDAKWFIS